MATTVVLIGDDDERLIELEDPEAPYTDADGREWVRDGFHRFSTSTSGEALPSKRPPAPRYVPAP